MSFSEKFQENWNKEDEHCPHCGNITKPAVGLNRQNLKKLLSFKANLSDFLTLFMIAMVILAALAYNDIKAQKDECESKLNVNTIQTNSLTQYRAYNLTTLNLNNLPNNSHGS